MSIAKGKRQMKRQMGQFLTPRPLACTLVEKIDLRPEHKVLEPSMGDGSFVLPLIARFMQFYCGSTREKLAQTLKNNIYGVELDEDLYAQCLRNIENEWGKVPEDHNFVRGDFLLSDLRDSQGCLIKFDRIVGNPPFGGTINFAYQDALDKQLGFRGGLKIKKETYSFFIVKSMDILDAHGQLSFICSDTFLTIKTMKGLRTFLMSQGDVCVDNLSFFSSEVSQNTVVLRCDKSALSRRVFVNGKNIPCSDIVVTPNYSWKIESNMTKYFQGAKIGDFMTATSGMTVGRNEYFVRDIIDGEITETSDFSFYQKQVTLDNAIARSRTGNLSDSVRRKIMRQESCGETVRDLHISPKQNPEKIKIPHPDYCYYNKASKASKGIAYMPPAHVIFWRDEGDAVYTYKKNGNWYLKGIGGKKYFFREGITWNLVSSRLCPRYLPAGYVLDSGAPCAFLAPGIDKQEMFFIIAWALSDLCNHILKTIINHTKNIQGKDFERLPYPFWISGVQKFAAISHVQGIMRDAESGKHISTADERISALNIIFEENDMFDKDESTAQQPISGQESLGFGVSAI